MKSVLVVYSGGLDSYTLLNKAMSLFEKVEAITFNYGQKHKIEIEYAKAACEKLDIAHEIVNLDLQKILAGSALVGDSDIPCLLYTSPSPRDVEESRMPSSA